MDLDVVDDLREPAYTGENRCEPCTVLNVGIAALLGSAIARRSRIGGALAFGLSLAAIYLRGYLVPGTPTLTKRYLPASVLEWFGKEPEPAAQQGLTVAPNGETPASSATETDDGPDHDGQSTAPDRDGRESVDPEAFLVDRDILGPCEDSDDLCLDDGFEAAWVEEMDAIDHAAVAAVDAAAAFGLDDADEYTIDSFGEARLLTSDGRKLGQWPSQSALVADIAAARVLADTEPQWATLSPAAKGQLLNGLRLFLETCPSGGGPVEFGTETVESCCQAYDVVAATCTETGDRLFEQRVAELSD